MYDENIRAGHRREGWLRQAKKRVPSFPLEIRVDEVPKQVSTYIINLALAKGLQLPEIAAGKLYQLKYEVTLFHRQHGFFGRTYGGHPLNLKQVSGNFETDLGDYVVFYTAMQSNEVEAIVELVVYEVDARGCRSVKAMSGGWTRFGLTTAGSVDIYSGSPRLLLFPSAKLTTRGVAKLEFSIQSQPKPIPELKRVLPANCVCGPWDLLPGILSDHLPRNSEKLFDDNKLKLLPAHQIYINNCVIKILPQLESRLQGSLARAYEVEESDIVLSERRLRVAAHNQWGFVNSSRLKNSIALSAEECILRSNGIPTIDSVFTHPRIALIFQLEYGIGIRKNGKLDQTLTLALGEAVVMLNVNEVTFQFENLEVVEPLHSDSEKSVTGAAFWTPDLKFIGEDWTFTLVCEASAKQGVTEGPSAGEIMNAIEERKKLEEARVRKVKELIEAELRGPITVKPGVKKDTLKNPSLQSGTATPARTLVSPKSAVRQKAEGKKEASMKAPVSAVISTINAVTPRKNLVGEAMGKEISRADQLILGKNDVSDILDYRAFNFEVADVEEDRLDSFKANSISFEFVAFKPRAGVFLADDCKRSFAFAFRFFSFPETRTAAVSLTPVSNGTMFLLELVAGVKAWTNTAAAPATQNSRALRVQFDFDPTTDRDVSPEKALDSFLRYLAGNLCKIWVYDAESRIPLGSCMVCLADLLRRREPLRTVKKEYNVQSEDEESLGTLQLLLQSHGRKSGTILPVATSSPAKSDKHFPRPLDSGSRPKTKVRSKPLKMEELAKVPQMSMRVQAGGSKISPISAEEKRKSEIVFAYKLRQNQAKMSLQGESATPYWEKGSVLEDAGRYRTFSRTIALAGLARATTKSSGPPVVYTVGETSLFPVAFSSGAQFEGEYTCTIYDPDARDDLRLVTDPEEWKYLSGKEGYPEPPDWDLLQNKPSFTLKSHDQLVLVTRLLSLSPPTTYSQRSLTITVENASTHKVEQVSELRVIYKPTYYNSCYLFTVPENRSVDLVLVPEIHPSIMAKARIARCSLAGVEARLMKEGISLTFVTPQSPKDTEIYVAIYGDQYCYEVISIFYVVVRPYECVDVNDFAGKRVVQYVNLDNPDTKARTLRVCAGNSRLIRLGGDKSVILGENQSVAIPVNVGSYRVGESRALLHAIDITSGCIFKRWLFRFRCDYPIISQQYDVTVPYGSEELSAAFVYENVSSVKKAYELNCSRPELLEILQAGATLGPGEKLEVSIKIHRAKEGDAKKKKAVVYVGDLATGKVDAVLFNVNFAR